MSAGIVTGQDPSPGEPVNFYGNIEDQDGAPAPEGIELFAIVNGQVEDSITVSPAGQYGGPDTLDDALAVNTGAGDQVEFRVFSTDGPVASQTFNFSNVESAREELNLTFPDGAFIRGFQTSITDVSDEVTVGDDIVVDYQIENTGDGADEQTIAFAVNGTTEDTEIVSLDSGEIFTDSFRYTTVTNDTPEVTVEVGSDNDSDTTAVTVNEPAFFDVTLTSVDSPVTEGETTTVAYEVTNTGDVRDTQNITFAVNGTTEDTEAGVTLNGGETFSSQFSYPTETGDAPAVSVAVASADDSTVETVTVNEPAFFDVTLTSVDSPVTEGETTTVAYEVTNTDDVRDTQDITLTVNGTTEDTEASVTLNGSETFTGSFNYTTTSDDVPEIEIEVASNNDTANDTVAVDSPNTVDVDSPGFGIVAVLIAMLLTMLLFRRRS